MMSIFRVALLTEEDGRQNHVHAAVLLHARTSAELARLTERAQTIRGRLMAAKEDWTYEDVIDRLAEVGYCVTEVICLPENEAKAKSRYADWPPDQRAEEW